MKHCLLPLLLTAALLLAGCSAVTSISNQAVPSSVSSESVSSADLTRFDSQGAVTVEVTPLNLENPSDEIEFDVALDTHSVDLSMDLAPLAILTTDNGITVQATLWDAPRGGHHVEGKLIFPATSESASLLEDANKLTLTIINVDVPSRVFEWELK
jgi:hypothetical protein